MPQGRRRRKQCLQHSVTDGLRGSSEDEAPEPKAPLQLPGQTRRGHSSAPAEVQGPEPREGGAKEAEPLWRDFLAGLEVQALEAAEGAEGPQASVGDRAS